MTFENGGNNPEFESVETGREYSTYNLTTSTADYQAEIDDAGGGSRLVFRAGTHDVDQTLTISNSNVVIEIRQGATVQKTSSGTFFDTDDNLNHIFFVGHGMIDGTNSAGPLVKWGKGLSYFGMRDVEVANSSARCISAPSFVSNKSQYAWFQTLDIHDAAGDKEKLYISNVQNTWVEGCTTYGDGEDHYEFVDDCRNSYLRDCYAEGGETHVELWAANGSTTDMVIDGLTSVDAGSGGPSTSYAIGVGGGGDTVDSISIKNCVITSPTLNHIRFRPTGTNSNILFKGNLLQSAGSNPGIDARNGSQIWTLDNLLVGGGFDSIEYDAGVTGLIDRNLAGSVTAPDATIGTNYNS